MAVRGHLSLDEQLIHIDADIEAAENKLMELKNKKVELEKQIKMARKEFISSRGLNADEISKL